MENNKNNFVQSTFEKMKKQIENLTKNKKDIEQEGKTKFLENKPFGGLDKENR